MLLPDPRLIEAKSDLAGLDEAIQETPLSPAVFMLWPKNGFPYLARTASLRKRLVRLLGRSPKTSRLLNLREVVSRIEYWPVASRLEMFLFSYELGRRHFPNDFRQLLRLRLPPYLKLILSNKFPRTQITTRLSAAPAQFFGPFRSRGTAEQFESSSLDLFQIRRCREDIDPSPEHPGCIYGEMNRCVRPCQQVVSSQEYRGEVNRLAEFLASSGESMIRSVMNSRDRLSEEMNFEEAARQHKHLERIKNVLRLSDDLARDVNHHFGVAVTASIEPEAVELWFLLEGFWQPPRRFHLGVVEGKPVSLDKRLREISALFEPVKASIRQRQEHLAILARWYYSSWRDGEWLAFDDSGSIPYRKLVNAIHRVAAPNA